MGVGQGAVARHCVVTPCVGPRGGTGREVVGSATLPSRRPQEGLQSPPVPSAFAKAAPPDTPSAELRAAATKGDLRRVRMAIAAGADLRSKDLRGVTPAMLAASSYDRGAPEVLGEFLLRVGFCVFEETDNFGWSPLHHACRNGRLANVRYLLGCGCDPTKTTDDGRTVLMLATADGSSDLVRELLAIKEIEPTVQSKDALGRAALHHAVKKNNVEICEALLSEDLVGRVTSVNTKDREGRQPLSYACEIGSIKVARLLLKKEAQVDGTLSTSCSPLMYALQAGHEDLGVFLVKKWKANARLARNGGSTPLNVADQRKMNKFGLAVRGPPPTDGDGQVTIA